MKDLDIIGILHDAVDAHLPAITEEDRRQKALKFLRGCKAYLAMRPAQRKSADVISLDEYRISTRYRVLSVEHVGRHLPRRQPTFSM